MEIQINDLNFEVELRDTFCAQEIQKELPIKTSITSRWGDEIYFLTDLDYPLESDAKEIFEPGDVVYWRSQTNDKKAIAIFFGPTPKEDGTLPRAASACNLIGKITSNFSVHKKIKAGDEILLKP